MNSQFRSFLCFLIPAFVFVFATASQGQLSSTVAQSGANDLAAGPLVNTNGASGTNDSVPITGTTDVTNVTNPALNPYTFDSGAVAALSSIDNIQITLTIFNGDSGASEFDEGSLTLGLDGFDTGILLNGFNSSSGDDVTLTIFSATVSNAPQILTALQLDNMLAGTIIDSTGAVDTNGMQLVSSFNTTLVINVPEPATTGLLIAGAAGGAFMAWRRRARVS